MLNVLWKFGKNISQKIKKILVEVIFNPLNYFWVPENLMFWVPDTLLF